MVDGLYANDETLTSDFAGVAYRIQLLGFNAIRMPFSFQASVTHPQLVSFVHSSNNLRSLMITQT